jgi:hypothetical protein
MNRRTETRPTFPLILVLALAVAWAAIPASAQLAQAQAPAAPAAAADKAPADLGDAAARLARLSAAGDYAAALDSYSSALPPADGLALLRQGLDPSELSPLAKAPSSLRAPLLIKAGDLALLLGLFSEAAARFEDAAAGTESASAPANAALQIESARCCLAAGDIDTASALAASVQAASPGPALDAQARLVEAWAHLLRGEASETASAAAEIAAAKDTLPAPQRKEARFLQWLSAASPAKAQAAALLAAEFPGSPEAAIAQGSASPPPLPHWYLGGLAQSAAAPSAVPKAQSSPPAQPPQPAPGSQSAKGAKRLQVGYFSVEANAEALKDELVSKRFGASVEARTRSAAQGEEKRWIVVVDGGKDIQKTIQALKDAGYEAYLID